MTDAAPVTPIFPEPVVVIVPLLVRLPEIVKVLPAVSDSLPPASMVRLPAAVVPAKVTVLGDAITAVSAAPGNVAVGVPVQVQVDVLLQLPLALLVQVAASAPTAQISMVRQHRIILEYLFIAIQFKYVYPPLGTILQMLHFKFKRV
jgi:hypothetical protein